MSGARSRASGGVRRRETDERVEVRWATVVELAEEEKTGVGGVRRSYSVLQCELEYEHAIKQVRTLPF